MPFTFPNGSQYDLVLLDTNVLSEISKDLYNTRNCFIRRFKPNQNAACFSTYSLLELHNAEKAYQAFLEFFSTYPCLLLAPYQTIIMDEMANYKIRTVSSVIFNSFVPDGPNISYDLRSWLTHMWGNKDLVDEIRKNSKEYTLIASNWQKQRGNSSIVYSKNYEEGCLRSFLFSIDSKWVLKNPVFDVNQFPGARMMLFSHYMRVHQNRKPIGANDVNDVMISAALPYMDAVITEKYQAEVIKQAKSKIPHLESIDIVSLSNIRH